MKKLSIFIFYTMFIIAQNSPEHAPFTMSISHKEQPSCSMPITIIICDEVNNTLNTIAHTIKNDLEFSQQFTVTIKKASATTSEKKLLACIKKLSLRNIPFALCIKNDSTNSLKWQLYDTITATTLAEQISERSNNIIRGWAHKTADNIWKTLTGNEGFFASRIAYCKDSTDSSGNTIRALYIADFDGTHEQLFANAHEQEPNQQSAITIAPRWHKKEPTLFYSQYTNTNAQLIKSSMNKEKKIVSNFDGVNMLANISPDGKKIVYCASRGGGGCQLYYADNNVLKRFTKNSGNNSSPLFIDDNRICFCSDFQTGKPQIYIGNIKTGHLQRITKGGYCTSPSYCEKTNMLVYHMMTQGTMQLFTYNFATKEHSQLTFSPGNKHEASWSPCGSQILFAHEEKNTQKLTTLNVLTKKTQCLTQSTQRYSYPHWGPCYDTFPVIV